MVPTTSLFRFRVLEIVLASTFTLVFLLETLGLSCPYVPEDVAISPLLLSPADVMYDAFRLGIEKNDQGNDPDYDIVLQSKRQKR